MILLAGNESAGATLPHLHLVRTGYFVLYAAMLWALALGLTLAILVGTPLATGKENHG